MQKASVTIISEKQSAAIKNKTILHTLSIICDVVDVSNNLQKKLLCNIVKVIGRVDWDFVFSVLQMLGYRAKFICMIKVAYTNIQSKIKINGPLSDPFTLMQGVRQGCLLSMVLYITVAYVFANFIDANKRIKGIQIGDHEIKLVNFADEITFFLADITCLNRIHMI